MNEERTGKCLRQVERIRSQNFYAKHIFNNSQPSHDGDHKSFEVMTLTLLFLVKVKSINFSYIMMRTSYFLMSKKSE